MADIVTEFPHTKVCNGVQDFHEISNNEDVREYVVDIVDNVLICSFRMKWEKITRTFLNKLNGFVYCVDMEKDRYIESNGKWMLFYPKEYIEHHWGRIVSLYRTNKLGNVISMKYKVLDNGNGIIIFYCKEEDIEENGKSIKKYTDNTIFYKTNEMSMKGISGSIYRM